MWPHIHGTMQHAATHARMMIAKAMSTMAGSDGCEEGQKRHQGGVSGVERYPYSGSGSNWPLAGPLASL